MLFDEMSEQEEQIYGFKFGETDSLLKDNTGLTIDITNLVYYLIQFPNDSYTASINFESLDETSRIIIKESLVSHALEIFRLIFDGSIPLYPDEGTVNDEDDFLDKIVPLRRHCLYTYNKNEFGQVVDYLNKKNIPLINFSKLNNQFNTELNKYTKKSAKEIIVDLTSVVLAMENNLNIIYVLEQYLSTLNDYKLIIEEEFANKALDFLRCTLSHSEKINYLIPEVLINKNKNRNELEEMDNVVKITDLNFERKETLLNQISSQLFGHKKFKDRFSEGINEFVFLNKIKEKKIFSIFLLGPSGVGKTEFARIIKNNLKESTTLAKINFGNYSSQDALNSLIGSPRGYIGSEVGELSLKLQKSKVGILLCDEFEKASRPIYNFFLELLEDGFYTDSQSREYDLDGYLVIFTSNLDEQSFYKTIPEELQSRLDLVCQFEKLTNCEKNDYVNHFIKSILEKIKAHSGQEFADLDKNKITSVDVESVDNIRDIKRIVIGKIREKLGSDIH